MAHTIVTPAVERVLSNLMKVKALAAGGWIALCPVHDDKSASLKVDVGRDGKVLIHCHAGCAMPDVVQALGLQESDLWPDELKRAPTSDRPANGNGASNGPDPKNRPHLVKSYDYVDASGALVFQACRFEPKTFRQRRKLENGNWEYNLQGVEPVLYRLPEVIEAVSLGKLVHVVEGEKDADALVELGLVATTNPMGAGKWRETYTKALAGAAVVILPDNDEPGEKHAHAVAQELTAAGSIVKIVRLPGLPKKGDVSDWLASGGTAPALDRLVATAAVHGPKKNLWKLSELLTDDFVMRPPPPVVPRIAWSGRSTLLAAREKSGKSTLVSYIAARVSRGEDFLGEPCEKGDVLLVGLEEFIGDVARRLKSFGADPERIYIMDSFLGEPDQRIEEIRAAVEKLHPLLTIVDSLVAYAHGSGIDENDAAMVGLVQPLTDLAHQTSSALVVVHHASKMTGRARGSTAITGAADVVCEFSAPEELETEDPFVRRMRSIGRVPVPRIYDVRFVDDSHYELAGADQTPVEDRVIALLGRETHLTVRDIRAKLGVQDSTLRASIATLARQGRIESSQGRNNRVLWSLPGGRLPI